MSIRNARVSPDSIQFYSIELFPTADGRMSVGILATICEEEGVLEGMDLGSHRVDRTPKLDGSLVSRNHHADRGVLIHGSLLYDALLRDRVSAFGSLLRLSVHMISPTGYTPLARWRS